VKSILSIIDSFCGFFVLAVFFSSQNHGSLLLHHRILFCRFCVVGRVFRNPPHPFRFFLFVHHCKTPDHSQQTHNSYPHSRLVLAFHFRPNNLFLLLFIVLFFLIIKFFFQKRICIPFSSSQVTPPYSSQPSQIQHRFCPLCSSFVFPFRGRRHHICAPPYQPAVVVPFFTLIPTPTLAPSFGTSDFSSLSFCYRNTTPPTPPSSLSLLLPFPAWTLLILPRYRTIASLLCDSVTKLQFFIE